jgi:tetratricopeptide (TPR) repeat protein
MTLDPDDPQILAGLAYCLAVLDDAPEYDEAIRCGETAIAQGLATPEVYNNLLYSQIMIPERAKAHKTLDQLLRIAPNLPAAHLNRLVLLRMDLRMGQITRLADAHDAVPRALNVCPHTGELFGHIADLAAVAGRYEPGWDDMALSYLAKAVALGQPLGTRPVNNFRRLWKPDQPRIQALQDINVPPAAPALTERLLDPLTEPAPGR